tara:strand:- start:960 stop:1268 length:309 start_codon:yes stop_codon:yes gene_type:complete
MKSRKCKSTKVENKSTKVENAKSTKVENKKYKLITYKKNIRIQSRLSILLVYENVPIMSFIWMATSIQRGWSTKTTKLFRNFKSTNPKFNPAGAKCFCSFSN